MEKQEYAYFKKQEAVFKKKQYEENYEKIFGKVAEYQEHELEKRREERRKIRRIKQEKAKKIQRKFIAGAIILTMLEGAVVFGNGDKIFEKLRGPEPEPTPIEKIMEETGYTSDEVWEELNEIDQERRNAGIIDDRPYQDRLQDYAENYDAYSSQPYGDKGVNR